MADSDTEKICRLQRRSIEDMRRLLYGDPATGKGGLAGMVEIMGQTLYGGDKVESGLVQDVAKLKRIIAVAAGCIITAQFGIQVLFHFWKP